MKSKLGITLFIPLFILSCGSDKDIAPNKTWVQTTSNVGLDASVNTISISKDGYTIAVTDWDTDRRTGTVKVYRKYESGWQQIGYDLIGKDDEVFGGSLSLNGDGSVLAIGAPGLSTISAGQVIIFQYSENIWKKIGEIWAPDPAIQLGRKVELNDDGSRIAILSDYYFGPKDKLSIYEQSEDKWEKVIEDYEFTEGNEPWFSLAFSSSGEKVAVGIPMNSTHGDIGYVDAFHVSGAQLEPIGERIEGENAFDGFGNIAMNADGDVLVIGGDSYPGGEDNGIVQVYQDISGWELKGLSIHGNEKDELGYRVAISGDGNRLAVGSGTYRNPDDGLLYAFVRIYEFEKYDWLETFTITGEIFNTGYLDLEISSDGNTVVVLFGRKVQVWTFE